MEHFARKAFKRTTQGKRKTIQKRDIGRSRLMQGQIKAKSLQDDYLVLQYMYMCVCVCEINWALDFSYELKFCCATLKKHQVARMDKTV